MQTRLDAPTARLVRGLFGVAMAVFLVTVGIGILNGLDLVTFDRNALLTHVHAGTLGWITLSVLATSIWLLGGSAQREASVRWLAWLAAISTPLYVLAFFSGNFVARAVTGVAVLVFILWFLIWLALRVRGEPLSVPRLALLAAIATLAIGAVLGVVVQVELASGVTAIPAGDAIGAHVTAMAFSYLVLVGMGVIEWRLEPTGSGLPRAGIAQVGLLFAGGLVLSIGILLGQTQAAGGVNVLCELIGVAIFVARLGPRIARVSWTAAASARHYAIAGVFVVVDILLLAYLLVAFITGAFGPSTDPNQLNIPSWLIFALDHAIFVGVMTNLILALMRDAAAVVGARWAWADQIVFWGMNVGLVGFVIGLALNSPLIKEAFSPIMGGSILLGLLLSALHFWGRPGDTAAQPAYQSGSH